ncbi:hypothetical protein HY312_02245 [Candidatus Saccharibacteria bacterium]|nr:hypothetical protein [Candidatus Saccharibacteria bacterium]
MIGNNFLLWENDSFVIKTPYNPHTSYAEGLHLIVTTKAEHETAWDDPEISAEAFRIAALACGIIKELQLAPWFNLQSNGNWGLLPDAHTFFHIHIYGRNKTDGWGKPIILPELPGTYKNEPMPESDRRILIDAFENLV